MHTPHPRTPFCHAPRNPRTLHGARSSPTGAFQESTAAPWRATQPHGRAPSNPRMLHRARPGPTAALHGIHGRPGGRCCFKSAPVLPTWAVPMRSGRAVLFSIGTGALDAAGASAAAPPETGGARWRLPQRPVLPAVAPPETGGARWRLPQRPVLPAVAPPETGDASAAASAAAGASGGGASRNRRRLCGGFRSGRRFRRRRLRKQAAS